MAVGNFTSQEAEQSKSTSYVLQVEGDSMEPLFPAGCRIVVDPARAPKTGDYVVARDAGSESAQFAQYVRDGDRNFLKPTNERYSLRPLAPDASILGVVVESEIRQTF